MNASLAGMMAPFPPRCHTHAWPLYVSAESLESQVEACPFEYAQQVDTKGQLTVIR